MKDRVASVKPKANGQPEYNMKRLMQALGPPTIVPEPNKYYTFVYKAKTPNIKYDKHPFILCTSVYKWGFVGANYHWEDYRRYSWREVISNIYEILPEEVGSMRDFPTMRIV